MAGPLSWRQEKRIQALIGGGGGGGGPYITNAVINGSGNLILTFSDSSTIDAGHVVGATGATGSAGPKGDTGNPGDPSIYKPFAVAMAIALG